MIEVSYDATKFEVATDANGNEKIDTGRLLTEMEYSVDSENGIIKLVGNASTVNENIKADGLYANIRFVRKSDYSTATESDLNLKKEVIEVCDWDENSETVIAW